MPTLTRTFAPEDYNTLDKLYLQGVDRYAKELEDQGPQRRWEYAMAFSAIGAYRAAQRGTQPYPTLCLDVGGAGSPFAKMARDTWGLDVRVVDPRETFPLEKCIAQAPYVMCISTIEHVPDLYDFCAHLIRVTAPGGLLFITTDIWNRHPSEPDRAHFHWMRKRIFTPESWQYLAAWFTEAGFSLLGDADWTYRGDASNHGYSFCTLAMTRAAYPKAIPPFNGEGAMMNSQAVVRQRYHCRVCGEKLEHALNLGTMYISDFVEAPETSKHPPVPLILTRCPRCTLVQLRDTVPREWMYSEQYWYRCIGAGEKLFARVKGWGRLHRDMLVFDTAEKILSAPYEIELPFVDRAGSITWRPVLHRSVSTKHVRVTEFFTGDRSVTSREHRWPTLSPRMVWKADKPTALLEPGDRMAVVNVLQRPEAVVDSDSAYGYGIGYYVGVFMAEGCLKRDGAVLTTNEATDLELRGRIEELVAGFLFEGVSHRREAQKHTVATYISGPVALGVLKKFIRGHDARSKRLSNDAWAQPLEFFHGFLDGWLDGDGHFEADQERWRFNITDNDWLIQQVRIICTLLGYRMRYRFRRGGRHAGVTHNQYCGWIRKDTRRCRQHKTFGSLGVTGVRRVWDQRKPKRVWDVTVGGDELFMLGNGVVTHNSSINESMVAALRDVVKSALQYVSYENMTVIDIGANDGTLLRQYAKELAGIKRSFTSIGVDPAANLHNQLARSCDIMVPDYWPLRSGYQGHKAHIITACAMFYDLEDPGEFVRAVKEALAPGGVFIIQLGDLESMLTQTAFDTICHEHLEYYSLTSLKYLLELHGLTIFDVTKNQVNGGSLRVFAKHADCKFSVNTRVEAVLLSEKARGTNTLDALKQFSDDVYLNRVHVLRELKAAKVVDVYGASTKGNTLLQYYRVPNIRRAIERSPEKEGKYTVGTWIPIVGEAEGRKDPADLWLVPIWHFKNAIIPREQEFLKKGRMLFPLPNVMVVGPNGERG